MVTWLMSHFIKLVRLDNAYLSFDFGFSLETNKSKGGSTNVLAKIYFSELNIETAKRLYELYKVDFEMFDYSPDEYLNETLRH